MTGKAKGKSTRPRRRKPASTEYAPELNEEYHEATKISRDRQAEAEAAEELAKKAAAEAKARRRHNAIARGQMRNAREEVGEAIQLFQLRYPDRVPASNARIVAKPLALALRIFTSSVAVLKEIDLDLDQVATHVARRLRRLLPLASASDIADAVDFRAYLGTGKWPDIHDRSRMLGVTAAECLTIGARNLKASDLTATEWKNLLARLDYASLSPEEKAERKAKGKAKRAARKAERHKGTPAFIAEQVAALGAKLDRSTVQRWIDKGDGTLREKLIERVAQVKDRTDAERIADVILGKFNDARKDASKAASAVGKTRRKRSATKPASAVRADAPLVPITQCGAEIGVQASASPPAADASEVVSAAKKESGQIQVLTQVAPEGGGQASSLPPAPLDTVTVRTTREEPMTEQTSGATVEAAGPDAPPTQSLTPSQAFAALKELAAGGDEAAFMNLFGKIITLGVAERFEQEKADRDRRNDTFMLFVKHPAFSTASSVALRLAHADRTYEEIKTVLDIIGETPTMDETAGEMAVALFKQGHAPASVAMLLLNSSGMRGRA